nr:hypothetical protein [Nanoarchaeum sp.]
MDVNNILKEVGLSESEKKVYLALLDLGDSSRGDIVNKSGIAGSKIYEILEKLQEKGLVSVYIKDKIKHFKPTNPNQLLNYLENKKQEILDIEKQAKEIMPFLFEKYNSSKDEREVEIISGMKGLEVIFREQIEILNRDDICYVIGGTWGINEELLQSFFGKIHLMREKKKIKTKMLFNYLQKETTNLLYSNSKYPGTTTKFIQHTSPVAINIYKDRTVIIIFGKQITSIHIKSRDVADSFIEYFNLLWKTASS